MAKRYACGGELRENTYASGSVSTEYWWKSSSSRWIRGRGLGLNRHTSNALYTISSKQHADGSSNELATQGYVRVYVKVAKLPEAGKAVWLVSLTQRFAIQLNEDGTLSFKNYDGGTFGTLLGTTSGALSLNQWYRLEAYVKLNTATVVAPSPPYENNASVELRLDGASVLTIDRAGVQPSFGIDNKTTGITWAVSFGTSYTSMSGVLAFVHFDDPAICIGTDADWVGDTHSAKIVPYGPSSTYTGFNVANTWHSFGRGACFSIPSVYPSTTTGTDKLGIVFDPTSSVGQGFAAGTVVKSARASVWHGVTTGSGNVKIGIRHNGTDYWGTRGTNTSGVISGFILDSLVGATAGDDWEVVVDANGLTQELRIYHVQLELEVEGDEPELGTTINASYGYYAGNGTAQTVDVGYTPDLLWIVEIQGAYGGTPTGAAGCQTSTLAYTQESVMLDGVGGIADNMSVRANGFGVWGNGSNDLNKTGYTYYWFAVQDQAQRVWDVGEYPHHNSGSTFDDVDVPLRDLTGAVELVLAHKVNSVGSTEAGVLRHSSLIFSGDQAYRWTSAASNPVSDYIQSQGTGTFQVGTALAATGTWTRYLASKGRSQYIQRVLHDCVSWTGDGTGARTIAVDLDGRTPALTLVLADQASITGAVRHRDMTAGYASGPTSGLQTTTLTGEAADAFTVGAGLNASGSTYFALVFADGVDEDVSVIVDAALLDLEFEAPLPWWPGAVIPPRTWQVQCEQRWFPVEPEVWTFQVPCEQRQFNVDQYCDRVKE